ncbi:MAG TPA: sigma factor-like helix-turn-helix DNA-binding protein [Candidatus Baltobacteraceae bacterium]|nr:sigma factor-like helix-turn-helix DNA-binding protein [Candidatus Baltobacteraceae bacterium]
MPESVRRPSGSAIRRIARAAWEAGDIERCLSACSRSRGDPHVALLRARALLRSRRSREALAALGVRCVRDAPALAAERALLAGTAYVALDECERGTAMLRSVLAGGAAHDAVRAEARLGIARAAFQSGDFDAAAEALEHISADGDVVFARALELRGWIAKRRGALAAALAIFRDALAALDACRTFDRFAEANLVMVIGNLAVELLDFEAWGAIGRRAQHVRWEAPGMAFFRFWNELNRSMADELDGRPRDALHAARAAAEHAPSEAFRIFAHCRTAEVLFAYGELLGYEERATAIGDEFGALKLETLSAFEEINVCAVVAETLGVIGDADGAYRALRTIDELTPEQRALLSDEPVKRAYLTFVEGIVADARSESFIARHRYRSAFDAFVRIGMTRRALLAGLRLADLDGDADALAYVAEHAGRLPQRSWIRERAARAGAWRGDAIFARLTRAERDVLTLLYEGLSTAAIAERRGRSVQTIRNTISALLKAFRAETRQALVTECRRRGFPPAADLARDDSRAGSPHGAQ